MGDETSKPVAPPPEEPKTDGKPVVEPRASVASSAGAGNFITLLGGGGAGPPTARLLQPPNGGTVMDVVDGSVDQSWVTQILTSLWPYVGPALRNMLTEDVIPMLPQNVASHCRIKEFDLGTDSPSFRPLRVTTNSTELKLEVELRYEADCDVVLDVGVCLLGVSRVEFSGIMAIVAKPLLKEVPLAGALQFYFLKEPLFDLRFKETASLAEIPTIKRGLLAAFADLLRKEMVAPHASVVSINPDLPLGVCDPVGFRGIEPQGAMAVSLLEGENLCRWVKKRPGAPLTPERSDVRVAMKIGDVEWHSKVMEGCTGGLKWTSEGEVGSTCRAVLCATSQILRIDAYDDNRLCGADERHLGGMALSVEELRSSDGWVTLVKASGGGATSSKATSGTTKTRIPKLRLGLQFVELGAEISPCGETEENHEPRELQAQAVTKAPTTSPLTGAFGIRIGGVSVAGFEELGSCSVKVLVAGGRFSRESRPSEPHSWVSPPKLRLPVREYRIVERLRGKGWEVGDIADLIERPIEIVRNELDPVIAEQQAEAEKEAKSKLLDSWYINDMLWVEMPQPNDGEEPGSQRIRFEVRDTNGALVAVAEMSLLEAVVWPWLKWLDCLSPSSESEQDVRCSIQLLIRFRPCLAPKQ